MKELTIQIQKNNNRPDTNIIDYDDGVIGSIVGTLQKGTSEFDVEHGIVYFYNKGDFVGMLWNVVKIEDYEPVEVKA